MSGGTKLFVYGVNRSCPKETLEDKFAKFGAVSDVYITEKGYAFVTMAEENEAKACVDELNGTSIDGQEIKVEVAHGHGSSNPRGGRGGGRGGGYGDRRGGYGGGGGGYSRGGGGRYGGDRDGGGRYGGDRDRGGDRDGGYRGGYRRGGGYGGGERGGSGGGSGYARRDNRQGGYDNSNY